jgi:Leu/Phe-tRNA-protein transferase
MQQNYYWSNHWDEEFYIDLAYAGFITITIEDQESNLLLLPEMQFAYSMLDFKDLHISKKVEKLIKKGDFDFTINTRFDEVIASIIEYHPDNWLYGEYATLLKRLYHTKKNKHKFRVISVELSAANGELVAGEVGYIIGRTYTSLTGFSSYDKKYRNYGTLQMVLLSKLLEHNNFAFWNLGHPYMEYKNRLGAKIFTREQFIKRWQVARDEKLG